ncbi:hypothetical protein ACH3XW_30575 [Acanthocheilonema viteae]
MLIFEETSCTMISWFWKIIKNYYGGRVITCCSATLFPAPPYGPYASSKCALQAYASISRYELEPYGVVVAVLFPGSFQTDLHVTRELHQMIDALWNRSSQEMRNEYGNDFDAKDFFMLLMSFINTSCYLLFI